MEHYNPELHIAIILLRIAQQKSKTGISSGASKGSPGLASAPVSVSSASCYMQNWGVVQGGDTPCAE